MNVTDQHRKLAHDILSYTSAYTAAHLDSAATLIAQSEALAVQKATETVVVRLLEIENVLMDHNAYLSDRAFRMVQKLRREVIGVAKTIPVQADSTP